MRWCGWWFAIDLQVATQVLVTTVCKILKLKQGAYQRKLCPSLVRTYLLILRGT